jgi:site-specific DNA recombinase
MISENTRDGLQRRAEGGFYNGNPTALFGSDYDRATVTLSINEAEAELVRQIFDWFTEFKIGTEKITRLLNLAGHRPRSGGQWCQVTIRQMLRNPVYCGDVRLNGGVTEGRQPAIITREQFEAAQAIIRSRAILPPRSHQSQHLLSAIAACGTCGRRLRAHYIYQKKADGSRVQRVFYKHSPNVQVGERACDGIARSAPHLEAVVLEKIAEASRSQEMGRLALAEVKSRESKKRVPLLKEKDRILLELADLGDRFTQWADRLDGGRIDEEQFGIQNQRLMERKAALQKRLASLEEELEAEQSLEVSLAEVRTALDSFPDVWETLTLEERREMLRLLIESLKVYKTHAELKLVFLEPMQFSTDFSRGKRPRRPTALATVVTDSAAIIPSDPDSGRGSG